jgi:TfoX/Sxy family transcriptional regulator of competence genes
MAYSEGVAERIRERFSMLENVEEKRMMGGLVFMYNDKMCVGVLKDDLMCRIDPDFHEQAVEKQGCREMDFTKRPRKGYVLIEESGMRAEKDFNYWIDLALTFNKKQRLQKRKRSRLKLWRRIFELQTGSVFAL